MRKLILAYSGGLDSAVILHWLVSQGYDVSTFTAQLGGHKVDFQNQPLKNGAKEAIVEDLREYWVKHIIISARQLDAVYGNYLLHVALGKIAVAESMTRTAQDRGISTLAHGAHKGENDYFRLNTYIKHMSHVLGTKFIPYAPWEDIVFKKKFFDRDSLLHYANKFKIQNNKIGNTTLTSEPTILGINYENGDLIHFGKTPCAIPGYAVPTDQEPFEVILYFKKGVLIKIHTPDKITENILYIIEELDKLGKKMGIGIIDSIEQNINRSKARCVYIQPATTLWHEAHLELGNLVLNKSEIRRRNYISQRAGELIYNGLWFGDEMKILMNESRKYNEKYNGWVRFMLFPGLARITGRESFNRTN